MTATLTIADSAFRSALGQFASGITVVSGRDADGPVGFTCQAFASLSLDPPLVTFCVADGSTSFPRLRRQGRFAVSVLADDQRWIAERFAGSGPGKWRGIGLGFPVRRNRC